jgi:hypothetical protein
MKILQLAFCILAISSGLTAGYDSWDNAVRASHGCGEYSPKFDSAFAMSNAVSMLIPTVILLLFVLFSWNRISTKISTIIVTISYSFFVFYNYMDHAIRHYAPCDRKGDESSFDTLIIGMVFLPIVWVFLSAFFEMAKFIYMAMNLPQVAKSNS